MLNRNSFNQTTAFAWFICSLGAVFYCYEYLLRNVPSVMASQLMQAYHIDATTLGKLAAFYYVTYVPMQLPVGILADRYGPKKLLVFATLICALGCILFAQSSLAAAYFGRGLTGFGSAFAFVCLMKLAAIWLPSNCFALAVGLVMSVSMFGVVGGNIVLSQLLNLLDWPPVVYFLSSLGLAITGLIWFFIPDKKQDASTDKLTTDFKQFLIDIIQLFKNPTLWLIGLIGCLLYLPISMFAELWAVPYLVRVHGLANEYATKVAAMIFMGMAIGSPLVGMLSDYLKKRVSLMLICGLLAFLLTCLVICCTSLRTAQLYWLFFLLGIFTAGQTLIFPLAKGFTNLRLAGTAIAMVNSVVMVGGMLFQPLLGFLLDITKQRKIVGHLSAYSGHDFQLAMLILPIGIFIGCLLIFFLKHTSQEKD